MCYFFLAKKNKQLKAVIFCDSKGVFLMPKPLKGIHPNFYPCGADKCEEGKMICSNIDITRKCLSNINTALQKMHKH